MKLEEEIKSKFKDPFEQAVVNVIFTGNWLKAEHTRQLKPYGISQQQFNVLRILRGQHPKPATLNLVQERMLDKMSNATRLVEKLRQNGLVDRQICPHDRRQVDISITAKGLELLSTLDQASNSFLNNFDNLTEPEAQQLSQLLDKLRG